MVIPLIKYRSLAYFQKGFRGAFGGVSKTRVRTAEGSEGKGAHPHRGWTDGAAERGRVSG